MSMIRRERRAQHFLERRIGLGRLGRPPACRLTQPSLRSRRRHRRAQAPPRRSAAAANRRSGGGRAGRKTRFARRARQASACRPSRRPEASPIWPAAGRAPRRRARRWLRRRRPTGRRSEAARRPPSWTGRSKRFHLAARQDREPRPKRRPGAPPLDGHRDLVAFRDRADPHVDVARGVGGDALAGRPEFAARGRSGRSLPAAGSPAASRGSTPRPAAAPPARHRRRPAGRRRRPGRSPARFRSGG